MLLIVPSVLFISILRQRHTVLCKCRQLNLSTITSDWARPKNLINTAISKWTSHRNQKRKQHRYLHQVDCVYECEINEWIWQQMQCTQPTVTTTVQPNWRIPIDTTTIVPVSIAFLKITHYSAGDPIGKNRRCVCTVSEANIATLKAINKQPSSGIPRQEGARGFVYTFESEPSLNCNECCDLNNLFSVEVLNFDDFVKFLEVSKS